MLYEVITDRLGARNCLNKKEEAELEDYVQNGLNSYMLLPHPRQPGVFELFQDFDGSSFETNADRWQRTLQVDYQGRIYTKNFGIQVQTNLKRSDSRYVPPLELPPVFNWIHPLRENMRPPRRDHADNPQNPKTVQDYQRTLVAQQITIWRTQQQQQAQAPGDGGQVMVQIQIAPQAAQQQIAHQQQPVAIVQPVAVFQPDMQQQPVAFIQPRITSYNVCYTK